MPNMIEPTQHSRPIVPGCGNTVNPEYIFILPYPELEDDLGKPYTGERAQLLFRMLGENINKVYFTYLMKWPSYDNEVTRVGYKEPTGDELYSSAHHLIPEIKAFSPDIPIMTFGAMTYKYLTGDSNAKITQVVGSRKKTAFFGGERTIIPNLDPGSAFRNPAFERDLKTYIDKLWMEYDDSFNPNVDINSKMKICSPSEAMVHMEEAITAYKDKAIDWTVYDMENSIDFSPFKGGELIMYSFSHNADSRGFSVPIVLQNENHHGDDYKYKDKVSPMPFTVGAKDKRMLFDKLGEMLRLIPIVGHNLKYDVLWTAYSQICKVEDFKIFMDTQNWAFQLQNKGPMISNSLKDLSRKYLSVPDDWEREITEYFSHFRFNKDKHYGNLPTSILGEYAGLDAYYNKHLVNHFGGVVPESVRPITERVNDAILPFADAELKGMAIDDGMYNFLKTEYAEYLERKYEFLYNLPTVKKYVAPLYEAKKAINDRKKKPVGEKALQVQAFNLKNSANLQALCFDKDKYGLKIYKKFRNKPSKTNKEGSPKCDKDFRLFMLENDLSKMTIEEKYKSENARAKKLEAREFLQALHDYKRITKLYDDYIQQMPNNVHQGLYKIKFNLNGTTTGRLSSPFHSMPNGCDIKRLVVSRWREDGGLIVAPDQSQLELRIIAALSNEPIYIDGFRKGQDAHKMTAATIFNKAIEEVTKKERSVGKTNNFAMVYGKTVRGLAEDLGISEEEASKMLRDFFSKTKNLAIWMDEKKEDARRSGYVITKFGRRIPLPNASSLKPGHIAETERLAVNYPVQSSASDIVLDSVIDTWYNCRTQGLKSQFIAMVHDSLEWDVYPGELFSVVKAMIHEGMTRPPEKFPWLTCPLKLSFEIGVSWGGALESEVLEYSDNKLVLKSEGMRKDFRQLINTAGRAYKVTIDKQHVHMLDCNSFSDDNLVRDKEHWEAILTFEQH